MHTGSLYMERDVKLKCMLITFGCYPLIFYSNVTVTMQCDVPTEVQGLAFELPSHLLSNFVGHWSRGLTKCIWCSTVGPLVFYPPNTSNTGHWKHFVRIACEGCFSWDFLSGWDNQNISKHLRWGFPEELLKHCNMQTQYCSTLCFNVNWSNLNLISKPVVPFCVVSISKIYHQHLAQKWYFSEDLFWLW